MSAQPLFPWGHFLFPRQAHSQLLSTSNRALGRGFVPVGNREQSCYKSSPTIRAVVLPGGAGPVQPGRPCKQSGCSTQQCSGALFRHLAVLCPAQQVVLAFGVLGGSEFCMDELILHSCTPVWDRSSSLPHTIHPSPQDKYLPHQAGAMPRHWHRPDEEAWVLCQPARGSLQCCTWLCCW